MSSGLSFWFICIFFLEASNETSARSGCSCVHNDFNIFSVCSDFARWCKVAPRMTMTEHFPNPIHIHVCSSTSPSCFWAGSSKSAVASVTRSLVLWSIFMFSVACHPCRCFPRGEWHSFCLKLSCILCQSGLIIPMLLCVPNLISFQEECSKTIAQW